LGSLSDDLGVDFAAVLAEKGKNVDPGFQAKLKAIFDAGEESVRVWRQDVGFASAKNLALRRRLPIGTSGMAAVVPAVVVLEVVTMLMMLMMYCSGDE